jgi:pimeloyl-ACP methyl ester carboxylesterase
MNPRLSIEWLRYIVPIGARHDPNGWRWKIDPSMRFGGFGPWRPDWAIQRLPGLGMPVLGVLGLDAEAMGWGTQPDDVTPYLPATARFEPLEGVGHFVHIEQPRRVADIVLDFLGPPPPSRMLGESGRYSDHNHPTLDEGEGETGWVELVHNRARLALHRLRDGGGRPLLILHGLGERAPAEVPATLESWPGPVWALDLTGHGASSRSTGGGYSAEVLMADTDTALRHLGPSIVYGRGLGAYVALLTAGARPDLVTGAILDDGPGMLGGGPGPSGTVLLGIDVGHDGDSNTPDPFALSELARDPRPPDYASAFARLALQGSPLDTPLAVVAVTRPEWLAAVLVEPGVEQMSLASALRRFAG